MQERWRIKKIRDNVARKTKQRIRTTRLTMIEDKLYRLDREPEVTTITIAIVKLSSNKLRVYDVRYDTEIYLTFAEQMMSS